MSIKNNLNNAMIADKFLNITLFARKTGMEKVPSSKKKTYAKMSREEQDKFWQKRRNTLRNDWSKIDPYVVFSKFDQNDYKLEYELSQHCINYWIYIIHNPFYRNMIKKEDIVKACQMANISLNELHDYYIDCLLNLDTSRGYSYYKWSRKNGHSLDKLFKIAPVYIPTADEIKANFNLVSEQLLRLCVSRVSRLDDLPTGLEEIYRKDLLIEYYEELKESWNQDCFDEVLQPEIDYDYNVICYPRYSGDPLEWLFNPDDCIYFSDFIRECEHYDLDFSIFRSICIEKLNEHNRNSNNAKLIDFDATFNQANEQKIRESLFRVL